jgi:hypothetical protein
MRRLVLEAAICGVAAVCAPLGCRSTESFQGPGACTSRDHRTGGCIESLDTGEMYIKGERPEEGGKEIPMSDHTGISNFDCPAPDPERLRDHMYSTFGKKDQKGGPTWMPTSAGNTGVLERIDQKKGTNWIGLSGHQMGDEKFIELAPLLPLAPHTTFLTLDNNSLTDASMPWLAHMIVHLPMLTHLNLKDNPGITDGPGGSILMMMYEAIVSQENNLKVDITNTGMEPIRAFRKFEEARFLGAKNKGARDGIREFYEQRKKPYHGYDWKGKVLPHCMYEC